MAATPLTQAQLSASIASYNSGGNASAQAAAAAKAAPAVSASPVAPPPAPTPTITQTSAGTLTTTPKSTIPVPAYGATVVDASGNSGIAKFDPNTGKPLVQTSNPNGSVNVPVPSYGSDVKDASGAVIGQAKFDPNTGQPLTPVTPGTPPVIPGLPTYPGANPTTPGSASSAIMTGYQGLLDSISAIEAKITTAALPSDEENKLKQELAAKKADLAKFDTGSLQATEDLNGQGRGITKTSLATQDVIQQRTRALQRLGLAQEVDTLNNSLTLATDSRKALGTLAETQFNIAKTKLDIAMNVQKEIQSMDQKQQDNARQYLLDVVNFAEGKTFQQLDAPTQLAITHAVANSPITLDMVKTALASAKEKFIATNQGRMYSVAGLGVVMVNTNGSGYKVVVPETPTTAPTGNVPTFEQYVSTQNLPLPSLTPEKLAALKQEYTTKYAGATVNVNLGKLSPTDKNNLTQAGIAGSPSAVQAYFLNTPSEFQQLYSRDYATGKRTAPPTLDQLSTAYQQWYDSKQTGTTDWTKLLGG